VTHNKIGDRSQQTQAAGLSVAPTKQLGSLSNRASLIKMPAPDACVATIKLDPSRTKSSVIGSRAITAMFRNSRLPRLFTLAGN
jgi:hypothetical protein